MTLKDELVELRRLKDAAEEQGRDKKDRDAAFKQQQSKVLQQLEIAGLEAIRTSGYTFSVVEKVKGQIEDRKQYVRWALENDEGIQAFLDQQHDAGAPDDFEERFYDAVMGTSQVKYKEDGNVMNQQARAHVDDGAPLPPGLTFRPDPYVSMVKS